MMLDKLEKFSRLLSGWFVWIAVGGLLLMMLITWVDVMGAKLFGWPVPGLTDIVRPLQVIAIASAIAFAQIKGMHVQVLFFVERLPKRVKTIFNGITSLITLGFFILFGWQGYVYGLSLLTAGETTPTLLIPLGPIALWMAFCSVPIFLVFLAQFLSSLAEEGKR